MVKSDSELTIRVSLFCKKNLIQVWQKENQDINGFFKITQNASLVKVLTATLADGLEITGNQYTEVGGSLYLHVFQPITFFFHLTQIEVNL